MLLSARSLLTLTLFVSLAAFLTACGDHTESDSSLSGQIRIDGSSTVFPITEAVAEEFGNAHKNVSPTVGVSGTGGGFKRFVKGETDISDASRPIKKKELDAAKAGGVEFIEIPVAYDGLSIVVSKENDWCQSFTIDDLKKIFLDGSSVKTWKDVNPSYPDVPVKIYAPGTDSGTFDYFKEVVAGKAGTIRSDMSVSEDDNVLVRGVMGDQGAIRSDMSVSEDDNVLVQGVTGSAGGLGFFGCAYYFENQDKLRAIPIDGGKGPVGPSKDTIESGEYAPFSRPLFIYVNVASLEKEQVAKFVEFYLDKGPKLAEEVGYVRLPEAIMARAKKNYDGRKKGTQFLDAAGEKRHGSLPSLYN